MQDKNQYIDELIARHFESQATPSELEELDCWLQEDERNMRQFLRRQNLYDATHPAFPPESIDTLRALRALKTRLRRSRRIVLWKRAAAAVAAIALVAGCVWLFAPRRHNPERPRQLAETVRPADTTLAVKLTLPTGEEIFLSKTERRDIVADSGTVAKVDHSGLAYKPQTTDTDSVVYHELSVPRGSDFFLELSDGTRLWLNAETTVRYPVRFARGERRIFVDGEAYLEVKRDTASPFSVMLAGSQITVLGTSFNVNSYPERSEAQVTLVSGKVNVRDSESGKGLTLRPGEQALIPRAEGGIHKRKVDTRLYCGWKDGVLVFKSNTMEEILRTLARQYDVEIYWHDESLKQYTFSGELKRYDSIDTLLRMIEHTDNVRFTVHGRQVIVARP